MSIGSCIKSLRYDLGKSQVDFAKMIGVSKQTLYKYENNIVTNIPSDKIETIARICGTTPAYIMGWTSDKTNSDEIEQLRIHRLIENSRLIDESILERMLAAGGKLPKENLEAFVQAMEMAAAACEQFK